MQKLRCHPEITEETSISNEELGMYWKDQTAAGSGMKRLLKRNHY